MVEIIGDDPALFKEVACRNCAARLRYRPSEVQSRTVKDYSGTSEMFYFIVCPRCSKDIGVRHY